MNLVLLTACSCFVSWDESVRGGVGRSIIDIQKTWGNPYRIKTLENGNKEYKYYLKKLDTTCIHVWIVDPDGTILDYRYEGRCRPVG